MRAGVCVFQTPPLQCRDSHAAVSSLHGRLVRARCTYNRHYVNLGKLRRLNAPKRLVSLELKFTHTHRRDYYRTPRCYLGKDSDLDCPEDIQTVDIDSSEKLRINLTEPIDSSEKLRINLTEPIVSSEKLKINLAEPAEGNKLSNNKASGFWHETEIGKLIGAVIHVLNGSAKPREGASEKANYIQNLSRKFVQVLGGTAASSEKSQFKDALRSAEANFLRVTRKLGQGIFVIAATGAILATGLQLSDGDPKLESWLWFSWLAGVVIGTMIGSNYVLESQAKPGPRNVVITGSTRGLGKALAREFLRAGDNVVVASRSPESVAATVEELRREMDETSLSTLAAVPWYEKAPKPCGKVVGTNCDVSNSNDVKALAAVALENFGSIDIWINNAGVNKGFKPLKDFTDEEMQQIVSTNLIGSMICTREAIRVMQQQPKKGHIFNMDGAGSNGASTPLTAIYGASKSGLRQFHETLRKECSGSRVGIHTASPGMVLTDLLLSGASLHNKKMFNIICEQPETVARDLVPRLRLVKGTGKSIEYLTPPRIILAIITAWLHRGRWFDEEGRAVYAAEADRLRTWAEERQRSNFAEAMEMVPSGAWVSLFSSSVICAYILLTNADGKFPGT